MTEITVTRTAQGETFTATDPDTGIHGYGESPLLARIDLATKLVKE